MRIHAESYTVYVNRIETEAISERPEVRLMESGRVVRPAWRFTSWTSIEHRGTRIYEPLPDVDGLMHRLDESWDLVCFA
jgi:hypothetical protein